MQETFDLIVIGAGAAGSGAALKAANLGHSVALIEKDHIGGSCTTYGCDPTKRLLHTADLLSAARAFDRLGLRGGSDVSADWHTIQHTLREMVTQMRGGDTVAESGQFYEEKGIAVYAGHATFLNANTVSVDSRELRGEHILLAAGSRPLVPSIEGVDDVPYLTSRDALYLPQLPGSLIIVGGGPVGVEFAQIFGRFGTDVTLIEADAHILPKDDAELAQMLSQILEDEGITIHTSAFVERVHRHEGQVVATLRYASGYEDAVSAEHILFALGRAPDVEELNLHAAGVETTDDGWIDVDACLRTNVPHIWAAGDVTGGYQFTHVASPQGALAVGNAFVDEARPFDDSAVPWVTYTAPALAHVGQTEQQLASADIAFQVIRKPFSETSRAKIENKPHGMIKLWVGQDGSLLGGSILGPRAGDLIAPLCLMVRHSLPLSSLADTILPYPTWAAEVGYAASQL